MQSSVPPNHTFNIIIFQFHHTIVRSKHRPFTLHTYIGPRYLHAIITVYNIAVPTYQIQTQNQLFAQTTFAPTRFTYTHQIYFKVRKRSLLDNRFAKYSKHPQHSLSHSIHAL
uniref:Uncharacterized protein n=1 Tax=Pararge aegeria TaxID=116150 RepID=S4PKL3_9NEOP